jgi:hypothetical protein
MALLSILAIGAAKAVGSGLKGVRDRTKGTVARGMSAPCDSPWRRCAPSRNEQTNMSTTVNTVKPSKAAASVSIRALIAGTQKHTPNASFTFGNATYAAASLVQMFQNLLDAMTAHDAAQANAKDVLLALRDAVTKVRPVLQAYRKFLVVTYGDATQTLADYGLKPLKATAPRTVEQKAAAAAKARATRKARGTTSKKQKASIKGTVTTTGTTPGAPSVPAKPAT